MAEQTEVDVEPERIRNAWAGRVSGCILGKPVEVLSFQQGLEGLTSYLDVAGALPVRDYIPAIEGSMVDRLGRSCCRGHIVRAEPDDDLNYTILALLLTEEKGIALQTADVARAWLRMLPAGMTWTAEREAYRILLENTSPEFVNGAEPGFDLEVCSDNQYNEWIGAQIRADLYGWVTPGRPDLAADLSRRDATLSHRGEGVLGAVFVAALGATIPAASDLDEAMDRALHHIPFGSETAAAVRLGRSLAGEEDAVEQLHRRYRHLSSVHVLNNLAVVVWALSTADGDFSTAVGEAVAAGWDTDCNGATVGGLAGLAGMPIPEHWTEPWAGRVGVTLAGMSELDLDDLVERTVRVARDLEDEGRVR